MPEPAAEMYSPIRAIESVPPGTLDKSISPDIKNNIKPVDYLFVFGQGPVLDTDTKAKPKDGEIAKTEAISWMITAARAAGELKLVGAANKIVLTGGKTGGALNRSEAGLMRDILTKEYGIKDKDIILEDKASNTLDNFALSLNEIDERQNGALHDTSIAVLTADFQLARARLLTDFYGLKIKNAFSSEQIFRFIAHLTNNNELHQELDRRLAIQEDFSMPESAYLPGDWETFIKMPLTEQGKQKTKSKIAPNALTEFEWQENEEGKGIRQRVEFEGYLSRGFQEVPEFWFGFLAKLNDRLLTSAVQRIQKANPDLLTKFGITDQTPLATIREALLPYTMSPKDGGKRLHLEPYYKVNGSEEEMRTKIADIATGKI